jgi:hypothetical protein
VNNERRGRKAKRIAVIVTALLLLACLPMPVVANVLYNRAVARCTATPPGSEEFSGATHGFQLVPPGFWCERTYLDGRVERVNFGLLP